MGVVSVLLMIGAVFIGLAFIVVASASSRRVDGDY